MSTSPIYLDHAATTPMSGPALAAMTHELAQTGNPSSLHGAGRRAHRVTEEAREQLAAAAGAHPSEVVFTSGGTESDNLALKGLFWNRNAADPARKRILCSVIEHHAVLDTVEWLQAHEGADVTWLNVDTDGVIDLNALEGEIAKNPHDIALITLMWANNEVGSVQPVAKVVALADAHGIPVHSDAVQAFTSVPTRFADSGLATMAVSGHKIGGPVGIGALFVRRDVVLTPVQHGGGHERALRSGTLNAAAAAGFAAAAMHAAANLATEAERLATLRDALIDGVSRLVPGAVFNGTADPGHAGTRLPGNAHFTFPGCEGDSLLFVLDMLGIHSSTGSACTAGVPRPSHVLLAMGRDEATARGAQRFTLGHTTSASDVEKLVAALPEAYARAKKAGMAAQVSSIQTAGTGFTR
ncbi:cysteine desulfurase family protein [Paeniglutamicibacter sulfureus]|uniref:cysteine desulfurase family protein n=1 Tax=Paeniglutamicibacter sulfureus TaxID=43666 RepID=UPI002666A847|nr:cysteine desulfurase family protein [Paeniglutamicibacter sulfureus]MDO2932761.1 cysteine desulfurase family protein [Paeniglutamicibacter sulfureus]